MTPDFQNRDFYTDNLAIVNQTNAVVTSENIYNEKGALIVPKGEFLTPEVAKRVISHKLSKPIEKSIELEKSVTSNILVKHFSSMPEHPEVVQLFNLEKHVALFRQASRSLDKYPLLNQKLTVMFERYPELYKKSVFGAFLSLLLCGELKISEQDSHAIFIGALSRDIGLLHIDPAVVANKGRLTAAEWRLLKGHVVIGYHVLELIPNLPQASRRALLEHHERADGFGYPKGKVDTELTREGQIIAFSDMVIALFYKYVIDLGYSMQALIPIIQINGRVHRFENTQAALRVLREYAAPMKPKHRARSLPAYISKLQQAHPLVNLMYQQSQALNVNLNKLNLKLDLKATTACLSDLQSIMHSSGITDESILMWINSLDSQSMLEDDVIEIEKYGLMVSETTWKFNDLLKRFAVIINSDVGAGKLEEGLLEEFEALKTSFRVLKNINLLA